MRISILLCVCFYNIVYSQSLNSMGGFPSGDGEVDTDGSTSGMDSVKVDFDRPVTMKKTSIATTVLPMVSKGASVDDEDTDRDGDLFIEGPSGDEENIITDDCEGSGPCEEVIEETIIGVTAAESHRNNVVTVTEHMGTDGPVIELDETTTVLVVDTTKTPTKKPTEAPTLLPTRASSTTVKPFVVVKNEGGYNTEAPRGDKPTEEPGKDAGSEGLNEEEVDRESVVPPLIGHPGILAAVIGGGVVGLLCAILLVMFIVYRMRKKDEGSYPLDDTKPPRHNMYTRAPNKEFYA